jgi:PKD repeat protein
MTRCHVFVRPEIANLVLRAALLACACCALAAAALPASGHAAAGDIGYKDQSFNGAGTAPTGSKPESKLWWNDGSWWASMWAGGGGFHIFRLDTLTQKWIDTGVAIDTRAGTRADTLWDGTHLYVASHVFSESPSSGFPSRLYRYSYNPLLKTYSLDAGFPVSINNYKTETLVIDKDSTGKLWATWTQGSQVMMNRTTTGDGSWGTPFALPTSGATKLSSDDISSVVAFGGNKIGVMWSSQTASAMYFAVHADGQADSTWQQSRTAIAGPNWADDHINLKSLQAVGGRVFAAVKTSLDDVPNPNPNMPQILLLSRDPATGDWSNAVFGRIGDHHTRPIVMIDETNRVLHMFATAPVTGGTIYEKTSPLDSIAFPSGAGTPVIRDATTVNVNNATSTKQNVTSQTGLVVLASNDSSSGSYWHAYESIQGQAPVADFSGSPTSGTAPFTVSFTDSSSGNPTGWSWDFGDGSSSTAQSPSHTYTTPGTYTVKLTATNGSGSDTKTRSDYITVTAPPAPPTADFSGSPTSGEASLNVSFTDSSTGNPTSWSWDFGDGSSSTAQNPTHTYTKPGSYTVKLTATNAGGSDTATRTDYITVDPPSAPPTADFSASPTSGNAPLNVAFTDGSTGNPTAWSWDFGDGTSSPEQDPTHTYTAAGTYTVSLTASNAAGPDTKTRTDYITVSTAPASYRSLVLADGPVSYWRLGEASGTSAADSAGTNTGSIRGGVTLGAPGALTGDPDTSMSFDGTSGYVSVPNSPGLNLTGDLTVEAWVRPGALDGVTRAVLHKGGTGGYPTYQYRIGLTSGNLWRGTVYVGSNNLTVTSPSIASTIGWTHVVMARSGSTLKLYLNGVAVATATASGTLNTSTGMLAIGRTGAVSVDYCKGSIDDVAAYPTALSAAQVAEHYRVGTGG